MEVLYEDNHIIIVNKAPGEIVQADKTGDTPLSAIVAAWLKEKYAKPGNVFVGVAHRLDRPVGGVVVFAKTSKALARLNEMFRNGDVHKRYWAITRGTPATAEGELTHYITSTERNNKSHAHLSPRPGAKEARLRYRTIAEGERTARARSGAPNWPQAPDTRPAQRHRMSHPRRSQIWRPAQQSRRFHIAARPFGRFRTPRERQAHPCRGSASHNRQSMAGACRSERMYNIIGCHRRRNVTLLYVICNITPLPADGLALSLHQIFI